MFKFLGRLAATHPWLICAAWVVAGVAVALAAPSWDNQAQDDDIRFLPARCASVRGYQLLQQAYPQDVFASRVLFAVERPDRALTDADLALVDDMVSDLEKLRQDAPGLPIGRIASHRDPFIGQRLVSGDGRCTLIQVSLGTPYLAVQTRTTVDRAEALVRQRLLSVTEPAQAGEREGRSGGARARPPSPPAVYTTGPAGIGRDLTAAGADSLAGTTTATVILVVVILLLVHRAPLMALVPLVTIAGSVWVALKVLALCTLIPGFCLVNISQVFAVVMLYGAGTDYCLFLISRYREELARGRAREAALARSVGAVGGALAASAGTVICGLGLMGLAEFAKIRSGGPAIAISLAVALVASLTLAPALLRILGKAVFWPFGPPRPAARGQEDSGPGLWGWLSHRVVTHPLAIWCSALLVLLPLGLLGARVRASYRATGELSPTSSSVRGLAAIQRHFTAGEVGPITVLLESKADWESEQGRSLLRHLSRGFGQLPNVAEVRSLTQPLGKPLEGPPEPPEPAVDNLRGTLFKAVWRTFAQGLTDQVYRTAREFYLARLPAEEKEEGGRMKDEKERVRPSDSSLILPPSSFSSARHVARLDVVLHTDPFDPGSIPTLNLIQVWLQEELPREARAFGGVRAEVYGVTVNARDLAEVTEKDRLRINALVLAGIFLILLVLVRRPGTAAYLLATVLLSYYATLGATTLAAHWWHGRPLGEVDWRVPFFLFTILVAVGEDYNILLITRALQERKRHGGVEGTRRALAHTGGTITSCGLIMAGTFATLMLGGLNTLVQVGFALAFGVLLDTFVVRPFLVPAFAVWAWRGQQPRDEGRTVSLPMVRKQRPPQGRQAG